MQQLYQSDLLGKLFQAITRQGGFVNAHAHLDRAGTITQETLELVYQPLQAKWDLVDQIKRDSSIEQIYDRMIRVTERMYNQGVRIIGSFIDVDEVIGDKGMKAADKLRCAWGDDLIFMFANQTLKGVIEKTARFWFDEGAAWADIVGGLPKKDGDKAPEHIDIVMETAKRLHKICHIHVDQFNDPKERESELLIKKTIEHKMQGKVVGIHGISIGAQTKTYRQKLYKQMKQADVMFISCPIAWIDSPRNETKAPTHNSVTPVDEMAPQGIIIGVGSDNIEDCYKPFNDGDMRTEIRVLMESNRFYNVEALVKIATLNGRQVLGLPETVQEVDTEMPVQISSSPVLA